MAHLTLSGHHERGVIVDHCAGCRLVWFDRMESVQLSGLGWIALLRELQQRPARKAAPPSATPAMPAMPATLTCPVCRSALAEVHNSTRFGRFRVWECGRCHGHLHGQSGVLAERGLLRPLLPAERAALRDEHRQLPCFGCGAAHDGQGDDCSYCGGPLVMFDLPRLAHALRQRPGRTMALPPADGKPLPWACHGCGAPLDPSRHLACPQCRHTVVAPEFKDVEPVLDAIEIELRNARFGNTRVRSGPLQRERGWRATDFARVLHFISFGPLDTRERIYAVLLVVLMIGAALFG